MQTTVTHLTDFTVPFFNSKTKNNFFWIVLGSVLITISAHIQIPFIPVPFTMQTCVILVLAMAMGFRLATTTILAYLAQGAMGLPVFAKGGGLLYFLGYTGGYLVGFLLATMAVGYLADRGFDKSIPKAIIAMIIGNILIYIPGVLWLSYVFEVVAQGLDFGFYSLSMEAVTMNIEKALTSGFLPYIYSDLLKIIVGALILPTAWQLLGRKE